MKIYWVLVFFLVVAVVSGDDKYTTKYDDIDIEQILNSERLLNNYFECVMERGNCTPDGLELRSKWKNNQIIIYQYFGVHQYFFNCFFHLLVDFLNFGSETFRRKIKQI